jgi:uncharacterized protein (TIGR02099 family)
MILWRRLAAWIGVLFVIALSALAVLRLATPLLGEQRATVQALVAAYLGQSVSIGSITAEWYGASPRLRLNNIRLLGARAKPVLSFGRLDAVLDVAGSLLSWRLKLKSLQVEHADIHLVRRRDGSIALQGVRLRARNQGLDNMLLTLRATRVRWQDRRLDVDYRFDGVSVTLDTRGARNRLAARLALPKGLGGRLTLIARLRGDPDEPITWRGSTYVKARGVQAAGLGRSVPGSVKGGKLTAQAWVEWRAGRMISGLGNLNVKHASFADRRALNLARARFRWQAQAKGWNLRVGGLQVFRAGRAWLIGTAGLRYLPGKHGRALLRGNISDAPVQALLAFLPRAQVSKGPVQSVLSRAAAGAVKGLRAAVFLEDGKLGRYTVSGGFRNLEVDSVDNLPGFTGLDGRFNVFRCAGQLELDTRELKIEARRLLTREIAIDYLKARVHWRRQGDRLKLRSPGLSFGNKALKGRGRLSLLLGAGSPRLDARLALREGDVARMAHYLPANIIKPKTYEWLQRALVAGQLTDGRIVFKGRMDEFPFRNRKGYFAARLNFKGGVLAYKPGWPRMEEAQARVLFRNESLSITSPRARVLNSTVEAATARIGDLREGVLRLSTIAHAPAKDLARYLQRARLIAPRALNKLTVGGDAVLKLNIRLPLSKALKETMNPRVSGDLRFKDAGLSIVPHDIEFSGANGRLTFGPQGFRARGINAWFRGYNVRIDVAPTADTGTQISVRGRLGASAVLRDFKSPLLDEFHGLSQWQAEVELPPLKKSDNSRSPEPIGLVVASNLEGTAINLPSPLAKRSHERRRLRVATAIQGKVQHPIDLRYGHGMSAVLVLAQAKHGLRLARGELRVNCGKASLPRQGVKVRAKLPGFSLSDWRPWFDRASIDASGTRGEQLPLRSIEAKLGRLEWSGQLFKDVRLTIRQSGRYWLAQVDSPQIQGAIAAPLEMGSNSLLVANLKRLTLATTTIRRRAKPIDPRRLPPLRVTIQALRIDDLVFDQVRLKTTRIKEGMRVNELRVSAPDFHGQAQGDWRVTKAGQQRTKVYAVLESADLGSVLRAWDLVHSIREGEARFEAHLAWPGGPARPNLKRLKGRVKLRIDQGRLRDVDPGAARLIGLVNIDAISRRLVMDFSDLFRTGFSFDTIAGDLKVGDANVYTDNLRIKGPSAEVRITGRTGLRAKDLDQKMTVAPQIVSGLPVAGAILGGPAVGAIIFLAQKLAKQLGQDTNEGTAVTYTVKGSWNDPRIELVEPPPLPRQDQENFPYNLR